MGATINYSRHKTYTGIFVKVQMFISLLFIALSAYSCRNFIGIIFVSGFFLSYVIVNAVFGALLGLFTFLLLNVKLRFKNLNENLWSVILLVLYLSNFLNVIKMARFLKYVTVIVKSKGYIHEVYLLLEVEIYVQTILKRNKIKYLGPKSRNENICQCNTLRPISFGIKFAANFIYFSIFKD